MLAADKSLQEVATTFIKTTTYRTGRFPIGMARRQELHTYVQEFIRILEVRLESRVF